MKDPHSIISNKNALFKNAYVCDKTFRKSKRNINTKF